MKRFPISTILGLTLGVLLAFGAAVSAFQSPTSPPPAGNAPAPLNTGPQTQTKEGGLNITGEVRTNNLCIGGACRSVWPVELHSQDVVGGGAVKNRSWEMGCVAPWGNSCGGYYRKWVFFTEVGALHDWRGVVTVDETNFIVPNCYEDSRTCTPRTQRTVNSMGCKPGWNKDTSHRIARVIEYACSAATTSGCSGGFVCTK